MMMHFRRLQAAGSLNCQVISQHFTATSWYWQVHCWTGGGRGSV